MVLVVVGVIGVSDPVVPILSSVEPVDSSESLVVGDITFAIRVSLSSSSPGGELTPLEPDGEDIAGGAGACVLLSAPSDVEGMLL